MERSPLADQKEMQREEELEREEQLCDEEEMQREEELRDEDAAAERSTERSADRSDEETGRATGPDDALAIAEGPKPGVMPQQERDTFEVFSEADLDGYRRRWDTLQASFVDDPWTATEHAGALAGELVRRLSERYETLRGEFSGESEQDADTEVMRHTIRGFRSIFRAVVG